MSDSSNAAPTVLLFGASRGIGYGMAHEFLKQNWNVVATVRGGSDHTPLHEMTDGSIGRLEVEQVDINEPDQVAALHERLSGRSFNILFVNAGTTNNGEDTAATVLTEEFTRVMITNSLSPMRVLEAFQDFVPPDGVLGVMSSLQGSVSSNERGTHEVYRSSKAALNMFMRSFAARHADDDRALVLMAPGWVRTSLGGPHAPLSVEESVHNVVRVLISKQSGRGLEFVNYLGKTLPW